MGQQGCGHGAAELRLRAHARIFSNKQLMNRCSSKIKEPSPWELESRNSNKNKVSFIVKSQLIYSYSAEISLTDNHRGATPVVFHQTLWGCDPMLKCSDIQRYSNTLYTKGFHLKNKVIKKWWWCFLFSHQLLTEEYKSASFAVRHRTRT